MEEILSNLNDIKTLWSSSEVVPANLVDWGVKGLNKDRVAYTFDECVQLLTKLKGIDWQGPVGVAITVARGLVARLSEFVTTRLGQPSPEQDIQSFLTDLQQLLMVLRNAAVFSANTVYNAERDLLRVTNQLETAKGLLQALAETKEALNASKSQSDSLLAKISENEKSANEIQQRLTAVSTTVTPIEPQIKELLTKSDQHVTQITKQKEEIIQLNQQYKELNQKAEKEAINLEEITKRCNGQQDEIHRTIQDANRLGMAGAFRMRKNELVKPIILWGISFFLGVSSLTYLAYEKILPLLEAHQFDWYLFLGRLPLVAPALWFSWFSVKQFSYTVRLWEDYSFKYASAMAFEGYKREASSIGPDMLKLLMEISIVNFSSNPLRIYDSTNIHASPLNELTSDSKGLLQSLLDGVKNATSKGK